MSRLEFVRIPGTAAVLAAPVKNGLPANSERNRADSERNRVQKYGEALWNARPSGVGPREGE